MGIFDFSKLNIEEVLKKHNLPAIYFFAPNQFWAHKNHRYIIDAIKFLKKSGREDIKVIFTGHDKSNKEYIENNEASNIESPIEEEQNIIFQKTLTLQNNFQELKR